MYYAITGSDTTLIPLYEEKGLRLAEQLSEKKDYRENSLLYTNELNFSDSMYGFAKLGPEDGFWAKQRLYVLAGLESGEALGLIGLADLDLIQRRAEVVIILTNDAAKKKLAYEPLKLLLGKAVREWQVRRMWVRVKVSDTHTTTILKGFGFTVEGKLREEIRLGNELMDVNVLGLLDREFHVVDNG